MSRRTFKTTVVLVAGGDGTRVFRCAEAVPPQVRKQILETAEKGRSATILIADKRGTEELWRVAQGLPSSVRLRSSQRIRRRLGRLAFFGEAWIDLALLGLASTLLWVAALL